MPTVQYNGCAWRIIDYDTKTNPATGRTTLRAVWEGRDDQKLTQYAALLPGGACPVTGFTNLRLEGPPQLIARPGPLKQLYATYTGFKDGDGSFDLVTPLSTYSHEERTVQMLIKGDAYEILYLAPMVVTVWQSELFASSVRYSETRILKLGKPEILEKKWVDRKGGQKPNVVPGPNEDEHYTVEIKSGFSEQSQDPAGFYNVVEYAVRVLKAKEDA